MNESIHIELTPEQRTLLLDGLSYLRSSALLETRYPSEETTLDRNRQVHEIESLAEQLGGSHTKKTATSI
jgi:hypothetical protein